MDESIIAARTLAVSMLAPADWGVLGLYFTVLVVAAVIATRRSRATTESYFLAGRSMRPWVVAFSILATAQSAATFVGVPERAFRSDLTYLSSNIGGLIAAFILAAVFLPAYYARGVSTPYQLLETRFGPGAKLAASWAYMTGRVFASGARVYVGALPVSAALFGDVSTAHMLAAISACMIFGMLYTLAGGLTAVIWTDVVQVCVYVGAAIFAVAFLLHVMPAGIAEILDAWRHGAPGGGSKLRVVEIGLDPSRPGLGFDGSAEFTLITSCTGFVLLTLASHGTDQDLVQRMLTCDSPARAGASVIRGILIGIPSVALFLFLGLLMWVYYNRPDLSGRTVDAPGSDVFLGFITTQMPAGGAGLMIAGVLAAGPAGINASLNSMASTFVSDVYRPARPGRAESHYVRVGKGATVGWGVILGAFALVCLSWRSASGQDIIGFVLSVMSFAYAGLLGVFLTALFTRRGTTRSVVAALVSGFISVALMQPMVWTRWASHVPIGHATLADIRLAFPWHLVIGTTIATAVACVPRGPRPTERS